MKSETTDAIVLRRTNYGEADRIVQLCTPLGRRTVMAKGVRKPRSKLAGGIELLCRSQVVLRQGRGDIAMLVQARMQGFYQHILNDYDRLQFAYEVMQLVGRASETVDEPEWFIVLDSVLVALNCPASNFAVIKTWFYLQYAKLLGDELSLWRDGAGEKIQPAMQYRYDVTSKSLTIDPRGALGENHIKLLRVLQTQTLATAQLVGGVQQYIAECANVALRHAAVR